MSKTTVNIFTHVMGSGNPANFTSCQEAQDTMNKIGVPDMEGVTDAFYPHPPLKHSHHLQNADDEIACAVWGVNEGVRQAYQEEDNKDETIK